MLLWHLRGLFAEIRKNHLFCLHICILYYLCAQKTAITPKRVYVVSGSGIDYRHKISSAFEPMSDLDNFRRFHIAYNTIEWKNGAYFAPEHLIAQ